MSSGNSGWPRRWFLYLAALAAMGIYNWKARFRFKALPQPFSHTLYAADGSLIGYLNRDTLLQLPIEKYSDIPKPFIEYLLAAEDHTFFDSTGWNWGGVNWRGLVRSVVKGGGSGGGSGLIQQALKNFVKDEMHDEHRTLSKKYTEAMVTIALTSIYSRKDLLLLYFNTAPLLNAKGFRAASLLYFGKELKALGLAEFGALCGVLRGGPFMYPEREKAVWYRNRILDTMVVRGKLDAVQCKRLKRKDIRLRHHGSQLPAAGFTEYVRGELAGILRTAGLDSTERGLQITTTLSAPAQRSLNSLFPDALPPAYDSLEAGVVSIEPSTGYIRAMLGCREPTLRPGARLNHAYKDFNQAGSIIKPFVYATHFERGANQNTTYKDGPMGLPYNPENYDRASTGNMLPAWQCLKYSSNKPVANLIQVFVTPRQVVHNLKKCGIHDTTNQNASLALGAIDVSPLEMAAAYAVFQNNGFYNPPVCIASIRDYRGKTLWSLKDQRKKEKYKPTRVFKKSTATSIQYCLQQVLTTDGTGHRAGAGLPVGAFGKTGTTQGATDVWFVGVTPALSTAIWLGYGDNRSLDSLSGGKTVAPVWGEYTRRYTAALHRQKAVKKKSR